MATLVPYEVEVSPGKFIRVNGPEDATDEDLIAKAMTHPSLTQQSAKSSAKPPAETSGTGMKAGQLPEMSTPDQLIKDAKASTPGLKANIPGAFEATQGTNALPTAGGLYDLASQGDIKGAWNALPESVRDVTAIGAPLAAAALVGKQAYNLYQGGKEGGEGSQGIKSRTIGADNTPTPPPTAPAEPALSPKEAKIATDIESKYGFNWKDVKNNFNVSNVPIHDPTQAEILASAYKNQQAAPQAPAAAPTPEAEVIKPAAEPAKASVTPTAETSKTGVAPPEGMREQYNKNAKNPMGPKAFNHLANNLGLEKAIQVWEGMYGKTNVPYDQYVSDYSKMAGKNMVGPKQPLAPGAKPGGSFGTPKYIPDYIQGSADPRLLGGIAGTALAGYLAKPSIEAAAQAAGQGDTEMAKAHASELLNLHPYSAIGNLLFGTSPQELETLRKGKSDKILKEVSDLLRAKTVGGGRGTTPASAYQR